jgi:hypothetical protein
MSTYPEMKEIKILEDEYEEVSMDERNIIDFILN